MNNFANIQFDDTPTIPGQTMSEPEPLPPPPPAPVRGVTIDPEAVERALRDEQAAKEAGFAVKPPIYALGTMVISEGVRNFRVSRREFEKLPLAVAACESFIEKVRAEDRRNFIVDLPSLRMENTGVITTPDASYVPSERAIHGLCSFALDGGGANYVISCPPWLRATNMNHWLPEAFRADARASKEQGANIMVPKQATLRVRNNGASDELFAVVGPRYGAHDADKIAQQIIQHVPGNARCNVIYDGFRTRFDILWHSDIQPEKCVAGEIYKSGVRVTTADDGTEAIKVSAVVERNLCLNLIIIDRAKIDITRRSHRGKSETIADDIAAGIQKAMAKMAHFASTWDAATMENVMDRYSVDKTDEGVRKMFDAIAYSKLVYIPGISYTTMGSRLFEAWQREPGYMRSDFVNAITRAAHQNTWNSWDIEEKVTTQGSDLLFRKDWRLQFPETEQEQVVVAIPG